MTTKTEDLGHGWFANIHSSDTALETMTIRNPDKGQRIDLNAESLATLRGILANAMRPKAVVEVSGGVAEVTACPDGFEVEIIDHDNEQHG